MIEIVAITAAVLALLDDAIASGRVAPPMSREALLALVQAHWNEVAKAPLQPGMEASLYRLISEAWSRSERQVEAGGVPVFRPGWGEVVEDPFAVRRVKVDLSRAWPEAEEATSTRSNLFQNSAGAYAIPFADVRQRDGAFGLPRPDDDALAALPNGTALGDDAAAARLGQPFLRPYWVVVRQSPGWTEVIPTGSNPLKTGVGAGGATIGAYDLAVLSGEVGRKKHAHAMEKLKAGTATIDDVIPLLFGHVPVQVGPNGAQGGWYNVNDRANNGGRHGMDADSVLIRDAAQLQRFGFAVPSGALVWPPLLSTEAWNRWIQGPPDPTTAESPPGWLSVLRKRTASGRYRYDRDSLARLAIDMDRSALEVRLDRDLKGYLQNPTAWIAANPYRPKTLLEFIEDGFRRLDRQAQRLAESKAMDLPGEDSRDPESVARQLRHPERRVSVRAARIAVQHAAVEALRGGTAWRTRLHDWLRGGRGDWLGFEVVLDHFDLEGDREGLLLGLRLPDADNRRYAVGYLAKLDLPTVIAHLRVETDPQVLRTGMSKVHDLLSDQWLAIAEDLRLFDRVPPPRGEGFSDYHASELASSLRYWLREEESRRRISTEKKIALLEKLPTFPG